LYGEVSRGSHPQQVSRSGGKQEAYPVTIASGRDVGATSVTLDGEPYPFHEPFWFAVAAFRPDIQIVDG
jgi:hypothetical protein